MSRNSRIKGSCQILVTCAVRHPLLAQLMAQPIAQPMALPSTSRGGDDAVWNGVGIKRTLDASMTAEDLGVDAIGVPAKKRKRPNRRSGINKGKGEDHVTGPSTEPPSTIQVYRACGAKPKVDTTIFSLPLELLAEIFSYLRTQDLLALARTSKLFCHTLVASESECLGNKKCCILSLYYGTALRHYMLKHDHLPTPSTTTLPS